MSLADQPADVRASLLNAADREAVPEVAAGLRAREEPGRTAIGHGIAIAHGRSPPLEAPGLLRLQPAVDSHAADGQHVDLAFAMAVPDHYPRQHLILLSELAECFSGAYSPTALRAAPDAQSMRTRLPDPSPSPKAAA